MSRAISSPEQRARWNSFTKITRYVVTRLLSLFVTVLIGVYLTVIIANMGGYVDEIRRAQIREQIDIMVSMNQQLRFMPLEERNKYIQDLVELQEKRLGLDRPFIVRSFNFLFDAMTLNLGRAQQMVSDSGSSQVRLIILERLPPTLLLFATANLFLFFLSLFTALSLSRHYGSFWDRIIVALSPTSAAPAWFYGIFLILLFAAVLGILPYGGMIDAPPPTGTLPRALSILKHMILPILAIIVSSIFLAIYNWRTFFLIYSSEDYVDMAKAKGLPANMIERRYILRPTLPNIVTSFALTLIGLWTGAIIFETVFNWPGLGRATYRAVGLYDTPVIVGTTVIYAYLLAITVFLLDFIYALVDPRVQVGSEGHKV